MISSPARYQPMFSLHVLDNVSLISSLAEIVTIYL